MDLTKPIEEMTPREVRVVQRIKNIMEAFERVNRRLTLNPDDPRAAKWIKRLEQYQQSLKNLREHGVEKIAGSGIVGVEIEVPQIDVRRTAGAPTVTAEG